jgi:hypothetical protein
VLGGSGPRVGRLWQWGAAARAPPLLLRLPGTGTGSVPPAPKSPNTHIDQMIASHSPPLGTAVPYLPPLGRLLTPPLPSLPCSAGSIQQPGPEWAGAGRAPPPLQHCPPPALRPFLHADTGAVRTVLRRAGTCCAARIYIYIYISIYLYIYIYIYAYI